MKIQEVLTEGYDTSKYRIDHPEDLVLSQGTTGANKALSIINTAVSNPSKISIKPDGRPAIKWGRDAAGFAMGDKYMKELPHSIEELQNILAARRGGGREDLIEMYARVWPVFEASVPDIDGFLFGDLLYSQTPTPANGVISMQPNTVLYQVNAASSLGRQILGSKAGIVVHTYLPAGSMIGQHIEDMRRIPGIVPNGDLLMIDDSLPRMPMLAKPDMSIISDIIMKHGHAVDDFINPENLAINNITTLPAELKVYANSRVKQRSFDKMAQGFLDWIPTRKMTDLLKQSMLNYVNSHREGFDALWALFTTIAAAKDKVVAQLDSIGGNMKATIKGVPGEEGYLVHTAYGPVKLINRFKFSAANFGF